MPSAGTTQRVGPTPCASRAPTVQWARGQGLSGMFHREGTLDGWGQSGQLTYTGFDWCPTAQGWPGQPSQPAFLPPGCENPKPSLTELVVLEHGLYAGDPVSKVLLQPLTGMFRSRGQEAALAPHCLPTLSCPLCDGCLASAFLFIVHCSICVT